MDLVDIMMYGKSISGAQRQNEYVRELCELFVCDVDDRTSNEELETMLRGCLTPWEVDRTGTEDALGTFAIFQATSDIVSGDTVQEGTSRLKKGAGEFIADMPIVGGYGALDLSNAPPVLCFFDVRNVLGGMRQVAPASSNPLARLILPETYPQLRNYSDKQLHGRLPSCGPCAPKVLLSKHFAVHTTNSNMFTNGTSSKFKEEFVYAPKDMDAQFHLNKFTKMSADTIVGILENLADVTDREDSYTLTLGTTNLDKLTEEQKNIAIEKGWNLA